MKFRSTNPPADRQPSMLLTAETAHSLRNSLIYRFHGISLFILRFEVGADDDLGDNSRGNKLDAPQNQNKAKNHDWTSPNILTHYFTYEQIDIDQNSN